MYVLRTYGRAGHTSKTYLLVPVQVPVGPRHTAPHGAHARTHTTTEILCKCTGSRSSYHMLQERHSTGSSRSLQPAWPLGTQLKVLCADQL